VHTALDFKVKMISFFMKKKDKISVGIVLVFGARI